MQRLQKPTEQSTRIHTPLSKEEHQKQQARQKQQERERKADATRQCARERAARKSAQLWHAYETRSITRLQAAYRGNQGRKVFEEQDRLHPGLREAVREQERRRLAEVRARREAEARAHAIAETKRAVERKRAEKARLLADARLREMEAARRSSFSTDEPSSHLQPGYVRAPLGVDSYGRVRVTLGVVAKIVFVSVLLTPDEQGLVIATLGMCAGIST
jgi:hypothetical protein